MMKDCMNVAAALFGVMVPVALLVFGWNVLAPEAWCWLERALAIRGGAIATAFLFLFAAGWEREQEKRSNAPKNAPRVSGAQMSPAGHIPPCQPPAKLGKGEI